MVQLRFYSHEVIISALHSRCGRLLHLPALQHCNKVQQKECSLGPCSHQNTPPTPTSSCGLAIRNLGIWEWQSSCVNTLILAEVRRSRHRTDHPRRLLTSGCRYRLKRIHHDVFCEWDPWIEWIKPVQQPRLSCSSIQWYQACANKQPLDTRYASGRLAWYTNS